MALAEILPIKQIKNFMFHYLIALKIFIEKKNQFDPPSLALFGVAIKTALK